MRTLSARKVTKNDGSPSWDRTWDLRINSSRVSPSTACPVCCDRAQLRTTPPCPASMATTELFSLLAAKPEIVSQRRIDQRFPRPTDGTPRPLLLRLPDALEKWIVFCLPRRHRTPGLHLRAQHFHRRSLKGDALLFAHARLIARIAVQCLPRHVGTGCFRRMTHHRLQISRQRIKLLAVDQHLEHLARLVIR